MLIEHAGAVAERLQKKGLKKGLSEGQSLAKGLEQKIRNEEKQFLACQMLRSLIDCETNRTSFRRSPSGHPK